MQWEDLRMIVPLGQFLAPDDRFLSFDCKFIETHNLRL
jgi:hypothetical protein